MRQEQFTETTTSLAAAADGCLPETVRHYANQGLIECFRLPNGVRLFKPSAAARVREIRAEHLAKRGGRREKAA